MHGFWLFFFHIFYLFFELLILFLHFLNLISCSCLFVSCYVSLAFCKVFILIFLGGWVKEIVDIQSFVVCYWTLLVSSYGIIFV